MTRSGNVEKVHYSYLTTYETVTFISGPNLKAHLPQ